LNSNNGIDFIFSPNCLNFLQILEVQTYELIQLNSIEKNVMRYCAFGPNPAGYSSLVQPNGLARPGLADHNQKQESVPRRRRSDRLNHAGGEGWCGRRRGAPRQGGEAIVGVGR
jgi:hypothetical protein